MDPLNVLYDQIAAGTASPPTDYNQYKRLLARAQRSARSPDIEARLAAVNVAGAVGGHRGMGVIRSFANDADEGVRRRLLVLVIEAGEDGLMILRELINDPCEELSLEAMRYLQLAMDRGATGRLRSILRSPSAALRGAAATLLGHVGGPGLVVPLRRLIEDEDASVSQAAREAIDRIEGKLPRAEPQPWWIQPDDDADWTPPAAIPLPAELPTEGPDLLRLLGRVAAADQPPVVEALAQLDESGLARVIRSLRPDGDAALNIGGAIAMAALERETWLVPVRRLLPDRDPGVRLAVGRALGEVGTPSVVMGVRDLLTDPVLPVRLVGIEAMSRLVDGAELQRELRACAQDTEPSVQEAVRAALGA